jgi:hypothetical protein
MKTTLACMTVAVLAAMPPLPAQAATDRKIVHGSICQPENPADATKLRYAGRGLHAKDADVQLVCPLVRDSTASGLSSVKVSFQRGFGNEIVNFDLTGNHADQFRFEFLSCGSSDGDIGNACDSSGNIYGSNLANPSNPTLDDFTGISMDENRAFVIKTTLPRGTVLKSITYTEKVQ